MAWLQSRPVDDSGKPAAHTRAQQIEADGGTIAIPDVTASHLCDVLNAVGLCTTTGMGIAPLTAAELHAWKHGTAYPLAPWEFGAVLSASQCYVSQYYSTDASPPHGTTDQLASPEVVEQRLRAGFASLAKPTGRTAKATHF